MSDDFPKELRDFVASFFSSVEQLELLLLLRNSPDEKFNAQELSQMVRSHLDSVKSRLNKLKTQGALIEDPEGYFRYAPKTVELDRMISRSAAAYITRRYSLIGTIYSGEQKGLEDFADSFKFRKKDD